MGEIHVHEFMSADGVIDAPTWTFDSVSYTHLTLPTTERV